MSETKTFASFDELELAPAILDALKDVGYEKPTPIQAQTIIPILHGQDLLGQAQTGTGKTAAFALPLLSRIDLKCKNPQVLVLAPTRELAIQVAEAFQTYAAHLKGFHVAPIYGGQDYGTQLRQLKRGVHVVVGTPGRVMDHMKRGTLILDSLECLVLDEADEMLRMGFIEDVEWVMSQCPAERQIVLFSATMPTLIRKISQKYLNSPVQVIIEAKTVTADTINQRYWMVSGLHKLDALTRILEAETFDGMIIFVRTKTATMELSEKLQARGFNAAPLNGDIAQQHRERTINQLKSGKIDILVATDVAARGLDVDRVSHVVNYDIPYDTESYIHRVGRTGRAGNIGEAILFVAPREKRMLNMIEKATRKKIELMQLPTTEAINDKRIAAFKQRITDTLAVEELGFYYQIVEQYQAEHNVPAIEIAAAMAKLVQGDQPLLLADKPAGRGKKYEEKFSELMEKETPGGGGRRIDRGMDRFRIEVGYSHSVGPRAIVDVIAQEAGLSPKHVGHIDINDDYTTVDLPSGMPAELLKHLKSVTIDGFALNIARVGQSKDQQGQGFRGRRSGGGKGKAKDRNSGGFSKSKGRQRRR
ncbi:MAG: DEAD/DEAH box helicase [Phycisphaerae bacterium]|nr:DEAD/DEAH box helicase [Phycisphaerae bacterium]